MEFFIFNYVKHNYLVDSFLESASLSHKETKKNSEWFSWKFKNNPFGETILACALDKDKIIGCVAYGIQPFLLRGKKIKGALSFETFVHPLYQNKGVFGKLIKTGQEEIRNRKIDLMLNFPNTNSLKGFLKNGWNQINKPEYWIKGKNMLSIPLNINELKKGFSPSKSNLEVLSIPKKFTYISDNHLNSVITLDYLKWRFFTFPNSEYHYIENSVYDSVSRVGFRGKLKEAQVLFVNIKKPNEFKLTKLLKKTQENTSYDIISFSISKNNVLKGFLKKQFFIKVPNNTNACFKILNDSILKKRDLEKISLKAINYHTY